MQLYSRILALVFGAMMLALSATVAVETVIRKLFSVSLGGVDDLSGYAIAIGAPLAFAIALIEQSHIRINLLHMRMPLRARAVLNAVAAVALAVLAVYLMVFTVSTFLETRMFRSIAQTPWATPLVYPQSAWLVAMVLFAAPALWLAIRAALLLLRADWQRLDREFSPETVEDELKAELDDLETRAGEVI